MVTVRTIGPIAEEYDGFRSAATEKTWQTGDACTSCNVHSVQASERNRILQIQALKKQKHRQSCTIWTLIWTLSKCKLSLWVTFCTFLIRKLCYKDLVASGVNLRGSRIKTGTTAFSMVTLLCCLRSLEIFVGFFFFSSHRLLTLGGVFHVSRLSGFGPVGLVGG